MKILETVGFTDSGGLDWTVPEGFITDGASIPQLLWTLVGSPFTGKYRVAAVFHDCAYKTPRMDKKAADLMLKEACLALGCPSWQASLIYTGVRLGGRLPFEKDQTEGP